MNELIDWFELFVLRSLDNVLLEKGYQVTVTAVVVAVFLYKFVDVV
jgi:hypothetical protein